jgi:thiamine phosphate synthase YjbQ (UPF0047 family)
MKSYRKVIEVNIPNRMAFVNITPQVSEALKGRKIKEGLALFNTTQNLFSLILAPQIHHQYRMVQ